MPDNFRNKNFKNILIFCLSLVPVLIHLYTNIFAGYGFFRDEFYYIACSNHLNTGYVDHPPFSILILYLNRLLFGDSIFSIRFLPALASGLTVFITCLMVMKFKGKTFAIILASICVILSPVYLGSSSYFSMNSFDILLWALAFYLIILIINESRLSYWILLGLVFGIGLMNKIGFLWLGFGFFAGLLFTEKRYELRTLKPYLTALIALTIFSPYVIWNYQNNFAHLEFIQNASSGKYSNLDYLDFVKGQLMNMNPFSAIIWLSGIYYFFFNSNGKKYKILGIIYLTSFLILLLNNHSKAGYLAPAYTILLAGGAVLIEKKTLVRFRWVRFVLITLILTTGILISPLALPILPVNNYINYAAALGVKPETAENKELSELPQFFADMHGWEEMAANVSKVYMSLPREERLRTIVFGQNYGEASAMEFYKNKYPIPRVISSHNSYWTWGYPEIENPVFIIIGGIKEDHMEVFENVEEAAVHTAEYSMPYENNISIFIAKNLKVKLQDVWNNIKHYD